MLRFLVLSLLLASQCISIDSTFAAEKEEDDDAELAAATESLIRDDQRISRFLSELEEKETNEMWIKAGKNTPSAYMERCGNRNPCADGLECIPMVAGKRCFPLECITSAIRNENINGTVYAKGILEKAGVNEMEFMESASKAAAAGEDDTTHREFLKSDAAQRVMQSLQENQGPLNRIREIERICKGGNNNNNDDVETRQDDETGRYTGLVLKAGALAYSSVGVLNPGKLLEQEYPTLTRICVGGGPQLLGSFSFVGGTADSGTNDDFNCGSLWIGIDALVGYGITLSIGIQFNGITVTEYGYGLGLGALGGVTTCGAFNL